MQRYTIIFVAVSAVHVSGSFSAHHQQLKLYIQFELLMVGGKTAHVKSANTPTLAVAASKLDIYQMLYIQFELLMVVGKTAHVKLACCYR